MQCPCGSNDNYDECCGLYHSGKGFAPTAEKLMRSRYSAFVTKSEDYLMNTWHPSKRPKNLDLAQDETKWLSLEIVSTDKGQEKDYDGSVEFIASFEHDGQVHKLHELSKFVKKNNRWLYRDGKVIQ